MGDTNIIFDKSSKELYLSTNMREQLLRLDINMVEIDDELLLYYMTSSEEKILHDIIEGLIGYDEDELLNVGFTEKIINELRDTIKNSEFYISIRGKI